MTNDTVGRTGKYPNRTHPIRQQTLKNAINCSGIALHSGAKVSMTLKPADPGRGIVFRRSDPAGGGAEIPARWDRVVDTRLCTVVGDDTGARIGTIEHLMAALAGCGVDNAEIEVSGPEVPVMDGSAAPFVFLIECAGLVEQDAVRQAIRIDRPVSAGSETRKASLVPGFGPSFGFEIDFDCAAINRQQFHLHLSAADFKKELSRARTFGFLHEVEQMRAAGLARGGSLDNAVVISGDKVLNESGLRYEDEFVRHKLLDAVGDLYLAGAPIIGAFEGTRSGHQTNNEVLRVLFSDPSNYTLVDLTEDALADLDDLPLAATA